jgi:methylated-DNA-[protein]-cysteine S-methyltransferase
MTNETFHTYMDSPIGELLLVGDGHALERLQMLEGRLAVYVDPSWTRDDDAFAEARAQLEEYFDGRRTEFDVPLAPAGSPFQQRVWQALREIPYGSTASYVQIARRVGAPSAARAVGVANRSNPIAVIIPCHRVIGADGTLTGYAGGLERKRLLLDLEAGVLPLGSSAESHAPARARAVASA